MKQFLTLLFTCLLFISCTNDDKEQPIIEQQDPDPVEIVPFDPVSRDIDYLCQWQDLGITEDNSSVSFFDGWGEGVHPWMVRYSDSTVELSFRTLCGDECGVTRIYYFSKRGNCIGLEYSYYAIYDLYDGREINEINQEIMLEIQEWIVDERLVGQISFENTVTSEIIVFKFWVEISEDDYYVPEEVDYVQFEYCYAPQLPLNIDMDSDGIRDFAFRYEVYQRLELNPQKNIFGISINSVASNYKILMEEFDSAVIFSTEFGPITSENARDYYHDQAGLANYTDYNDPYKKYNNWDSQYLNPFYSNPDLTNDYLLIKKTVGSNVYYGWINFTIDVDNCDIIIHDTYLNPIANEHVTIN